MGHVSLKEFVDQMVDSGNLYFEMILTAGKENLYDNPTFCKRKTKKYGFCEYARDV